ncbi:MAG TPA: FAD-binding oxidoreductase [Solimonas sp.]
MQDTVSHSSPSTLERSRAARAWFGSRWLWPLNDARAIDDLLGLVNPLWSVEEIRAKVVAIVDETADTRSFVLEPNRHWPGFVAGQYVPVNFERDGRRLQRCYSLSSSPRAAQLRITVKRQAAGRMSNALHDGLQVGDVLTLGAPEGCFTLPLDATPTTVLVGAGSGVTPLMAQLYEMQAAGYAGAVRFVQVCRTPADAIFRAELEALAAAWPALTVTFHYTAEAGRLSPSALQQQLPDGADHQLMLCGPAAFMAAVRGEWEARGWGHRVKTEAFSLTLPTVAAEGAAAEVRCGRSEQMFTAQAGQPLLSEAEAAGLSPRHGCRIGICHACKCMKKSGTVQNLLTGEISDAPDEAIQLCISAARSDLELDL